VDYTIENFIFSKDNAASRDFCEHIIKDFESCYADVSRTSTEVRWGDDQFPCGKLDRNDAQVFLPTSLCSYFKEIQDIVFDGLEEYQHTIASVKSNILISPTAKMQKTPIGGGYSVWHSEHGGGNSAARSLVWMIYLNDVHEGGDTEFLYQHMKVQPKQGTLVIWPAGITHPHRGNPPYSNEKYVLTGWFEVAPSEATLQGLVALKNAK